MANFTPICEWVLRIEDSTLSGKTVDLGDGQGLTRFGIGQKSHPELPLFFFQCPTLTALKIAEDTYRQDYWNRFCGDRIADDGVASCLLSFAINDGTSREVKMLQTALDQYADGVLGPVTLAATNRANAKLLAAELREEQAAFYKAIPNNQQFISGWLRRAALIYPHL